MALRAGAPTTSAPGGPDTGSRSAQRRRMVAAVLGARRAAVGVSPAGLQVRPGPSGGRGGLGGRGEGPEGLGRPPGPRCFLPAVTPGPGWGPHSSALQPGSPCPVCRPQVPLVRANRTVIRLLKGKSRSRAQVPQRRSGDTSRPQHSPVFPDL